MANNTGKKRVLGRGLDAILKSPDTDITSEDISGNYVAGAIAELEIDRIEVNPFQPRTDFDQMELRELAESIKVQGVIQPVTVRKVGFNKYQLIAGERRLRASQLAGADRVPAFIRIANDEQMLELALIENIHRKSLNALEIAISYQRLIDECKLTQEKLSEKIGKNRPTITNYLRLLKLPPEVQVALRDGLITMGHARALITIEKVALQKKILDQIIHEGLNVRQVEMLVRKPEKKKPAKKEKASLPEKYSKASEDLGLYFDAKVSLRRSNNGQGSIVISFTNDDELDTIIAKMKK